MSKRKLAGMLAMLLSLTACAGPRSQTPDAVHTQAVSQSPSAVETQDAEIPNQDVEFTD